MEIFKIVVLALSALLLTFVGLMRLSKPIKTLAESSGIKLNPDVNLLNEVRGMSSLMFSGGIIIALGTVLPMMSFTSHLVAILLFLGFALGRTISIGVDGRPNPKLIQGLTFELIFGTLNVVCLVL